MRNSHFGTVLNIPLARLKIRRPIIFGNLAIVNPRGRSGLTVHGSHGSLWGISERRGCCLNFIQLLAQRSNLLFDHLLKRGFRIAVVCGKKNEGRDTT